ncbi:Cyclic nucleotide-binding domain protein [Desulfosarcina cetonica]|uniref:putative nucleotidyltransferase substrate binding domain-containing protein n=1 Tax=Desulfosarcina cetonica TaxID=90730 RepID=UPI000AF21C55|nr:putative nucleotidyltransferase substrate binding domain-containing protein [Desulfosarcina cetonica]VTR64813.1 Cyclic nucleotide-binding domain protein [Desulfosarcina cetonica]
MKPETLRFLSSMPHFSFLTPSEMEMVVAQASTTRIARGDRISVQGESRVDNVLVILDGQLSLYQKDKGEDRLTGYIKKGEVYGGISVMLNAGIALRTTRADTVVAAVTIPARVITELCARNRAFHEYFLDNFSHNIFDESLDAITRAAQARLFISGLDPFTFLGEDDLERVATSLSRVSYPKGTVLFVQGRTRVGYLYILQKGAAERYYEENGQKTMRELLSEGDIYGGISILLNDGLSVRTMAVIEDASFYVLAEPIFLNICSRNSTFSEYFSDTFGKRMLSRSYAAIIAKTLRPKAADLQLFNQPLSQIYSPHPVFCHAGMTIREVARLMTRHKTSYAFVRNENPETMGIVTEKDFTRKVIARGISIDQPVAAIMSSPLRAIPEKAMIFEAMMTMMEQDFQHVGVIDANDKVIGMLSSRDILAFQGQSPLFLLREIQLADGMEKIVEKQGQLAGMVRGLINNGANARNLTYFITTVADTILKKTARMALDELGPAPVPFVFMIMGSEGREEQTLKTDQDNAIVYQDPRPELAEGVAAYFFEFGEMVCGLLNQAGYAYCTGQVMAKNPRWCQPFSQWKIYFRDWIRAAEAEDLLQASIFFDFRTGFGETALVERLRQYLFSALEGWSGFFRHLTENALYFKPPLGFFRNFVVESKGRHRNALDIKSAMTPIVDFARVYALKHRIEATNTLERLEQLRIQKVITPQEYEELEKAYSFLMQLRFVRQITAVMDDNSKPDNYINPKKLTHIEQTMLKEIFKRVEKFQAKMNFDFIGIA